MGWYKLKGEKELICGYLGCTSIHFELLKLLERHEKSLTICAKCRCVRVMSQHIEFDEPIEYSVSFERKDHPRKFEFGNWIVFIAVVGISIISAIIIVMYTKMHREKLLQHKTRNDIYKYINKMVNSIL